MARNPIITDDCLNEVLEAYDEKCVPVTEIASWFGVTRQAVYKFFWKHGVDTAKITASRRELECDGCGKVYEVKRCEFRRIRDEQKKHFCSRVCYNVYLEDSDSLTNRHHQRIARKKVGKVFDLKSEHVVHHKDKNHFNTDISNFVVFASQSDHIRYHHQLRQGEVTVEPVWDGESYLAKLEAAKKNRVDVAGFFNPQPKGG
jgi:hypothetical protein